MTHGRRLVASVALVLVATLLAAVEFSRTRESVAQAPVGELRASPAPVITTGAAVPATATIGFADGGIVAGSATSTGLRLTPVAFPRGRSAPSELTLRLGRRPTALAFDAAGRGEVVAVRTRGDRRALWRAQLRDGEGIDVRRLRLPPGLPTGDDARISLVRWSGRDGDLVSLQQRGSRVLVDVWSGESGFRTRIFSGYAGFSRGSLDLRKVLTTFVERADGPPDLVLVSMGSPTATSRTEVHLLSGRSELESYVLDGSTSLPIAPAGATSVLARRGRSAAISLYVVDRRSGELQVVTLPRR